ncbi:MAG: peptide chain release factor N(5)-glutamine methyltransferase [Candidatus Paceibacterota bacterium]|jgi:release factor glutamine methyltransferase
MKINSQDRAWLLRDKYAGLETPAFLADVKKIEQGEPLDYVIGWRDFLGCRIDLSERPLIPRAETEFWTELVIKKIGQQPAKVLDIFAGSGCVGLAVLKHCLQVEVTFADSEESCLRQIRKNRVKLRHAASLVKIIKSDVFSNIKNKFDFILANPPYVPTVGRGSRVQTSASKYEPATALWSGADGLDIIRRFLTDAKNHLTPTGEIWLEFSVGQKTKIEKLLRENGYKQCQFHRDQFGRFRFVVIGA